VLLLAPAVLPPLNPALNSLAFLVGTWRGRGRGYYPTIEKFEYEEEVQFRHVGKPFLAYTQRTWAANETKAPMHTESGFLRPVPTMENKLEMLICDPTGVSQIYTGVVDPAGKRIELETISVQTTPTAKSVTELRRIITVETKEAETTLGYTLDMAAVGQKLQQHLDAVLVKQPDVNVIDTISMEEIHEHKEKELSGFTLLDVRERDEFETGHLPEALNIPLGQLITIVAKHGEEVLQPLRKGNVLVYCNTGYRADIAAHEMKKWDLTQNVWSLKGGWTGQGQ